MDRERQSIAPTRRHLGALMLAGAAVTLPKGARAATTIPTDPLPAIYAERRRVYSLLNTERYGSEAEAEALMDVWGACDAQAIASPATTAAGAVASIKWAREELIEFGFQAEHDADDRGVRIILALLDGALAALRQEGGAA